MSDIVSSPFFGIIISVIAYEIGVLLNRKLKSPIANPLLIGIILVIAFLEVFHIPYDSYAQGGDIISLFLAPATAALAISIYKNFGLLKENIIPIMSGAIVGSAVSIGSVIFFCKLFGLDNSLTASLIPKSVTTPIAMDISNNLGGITSVTVVVVIITGIFGAMLSPTLIKLLRIKNPVTRGVSIGVSSHAVGTSKAVEIGEVEGAMSGIAIGIAGLVTVVFSLFL